MVGVIPGAAGSPGRGPERPVSGGARWFNQSASLAYGVPWFCESRHRHQFRGAFKNNSTVLAGTLRHLSRMDQ